MTEIQEGRLVFRFDNGCDVGKYDDWAFYRNQFARVSHSTAVDFVCVHREECWLVEVKDYSSHRRTKPSELGDEVGRKVRDTLAGLVAGSVNANNADERTIARRACRSRALRVALHLEQPAHPSRLHPQVDPADVQAKLRQCVRGIDRHARVVDAASPTGPWSVVVR